jgi:hypothetical protein
LEVHQDGGIAMCNPGGVITKFLGGDTERYGGGEYGGQSAAALEELARISREQWDLSRAEYEDNRPLLDQLRREGIYDKEVETRVRGRSSAEIERNFEAASRDHEIKMSRFQQISDPAYQASGTSGQVQKATAKAGYVDQAVRGEKDRRTQIAAGITGRQNPSMTGASDSLANVVSGYGALQKTAYDQRIAMRDSANLFGIPGFSVSLKRGGHIKAAGGGVGMPIQDPQQYDENRDVPMMKHPDGSFSDPNASGDESMGHLTGPGTETSDSIPAQLSHGEYVLPAFAVTYLGTEKIDKMVEKAREGMGEEPAEGDAPSRVAGENPQGDVEAAGGGIAQRDPATDFSNSIIARKRHRRTLGSGMPIRSANGGLISRAIQGQEYDPDSWGLRAGQDTSRRRRPLRQFERAPSGRADPLMREYGKGLVDKLGNVFSGEGASEAPTQFPTGEAGTASAGAVGSSPLLAGEAATAAGATAATAGTSSGLAPLIALVKKGGRVKKGCGMKLNRSAA